MFCLSLRSLLASNQDDLKALDEIQSEFSQVMQTQLDKMWAAKLGLDIDLDLHEGTLNTEADKQVSKALFHELVSELQTLMLQAPLDYTMFFRELSNIPDNISSLKKSFYISSTQDTQETDKRWEEWLAKWKTLLNRTCGENAMAPRSIKEISKQMKLVNPKYILREWFLVPAYQQATGGNYGLIKELQEVMTNPYAEQSKEVEDKYYRLKPPEFFAVGGTSHLSCSS